MFRGSLLLLFLPLLLSSWSGSSSPISGTNQNGNSNCTPSCGRIEIRAPFRLKGDPPKCGDKKFELSCVGEEGNDRVALLFYLFSAEYFVLAINYGHFTIRLVDADVHYNISHNPRYSLSIFNFTQGDDDDDHGYLGLYPYYPSKYSYDSLYPLNFVICERPMNSSSSVSIVEAAPCLDDGDTRRSSYSYFMVSDYGIGIFDLGESCKITLMYMVVSSSRDKNMKTCQGIYDEIAQGFQLSWILYTCDKWCASNHEWCSPIFDINGTPTGRCYPKSHAAFENRWYFKFINYIIARLEAFIDPIYTHFHLDRPFPFTYPYLHRNELFGCFFVYTVLYLAAKFSFGFPCVAAFLVYKWRRRHLSMYNDIEDFLQTNNNFIPIRYSYSEIKKMAKGFKDTLGEGGYGSVYKGKLRSGRLVAIKMLSKPKANGQEFINEVATIGRIHHVNVVRLIGFCVEGSKRALIYDFMPNGSLEKYIFSKQGVPLSCERIYEIAIEVARGIEYLHRGCDMQILHFDIKPHNILLDENFTAKVSDFGLARLYPLDDSIVPLTAARGTMGYIAPEICYKNFGGVSYKADVYSFGMLLMEMAGRRKNLNANVDVDRESQLSQVYYPTWVFDRLNEGKELQMEDATEEEKKITKKMIMVALWCIQMKPSERPSMNKVVEMLEGEMESLQMPPKPFLYPQQMTVNAQVGNPNPTCASTASKSTEITSS